MQPMKFNRQKVHLILAFLLTLVLLGSSFLVADVAQAVPPAQEIDANDAPPSEQSEGALNSVYLPMVASDSALTDQTTVESATSAAVPLFRSFSGKYGYTVIGNTETVDDTGYNFKEPTSASLNLPAGTTVAAAYLYWGLSGSNDPTVTLNGAAVNAQDSQVGSFVNGLYRYTFYGYMADVTTLVRGGGAYTVHDMWWNNGFPYSNALGAFGNWSLVVVYQGDALPATNIHVYKQWDIRWPVDYAYTYGGLVDTGCARNGKYTVVAHEGDTYKGEYFYINGQYKGDNLFSGGYSGTPNLDIDTYNLSLAAGQSSLSTLIDAYWVGNGYEMIATHAVVIQTDACTPPTPTPAPPTATPTNTPVPQLAQLGDRVWEDVNRDGIQNNNEPGVDGIAVRLLDCNRNIVRDTTTANGGNYLFGNLPAGCYIVRFININNNLYDFTTPDVGDNASDSDIVFADSVTPGIINGETDSVNLAAGDNNRTVDAGLVRKQGLIGDRVWNDTNRNGVQDNGEVGVPNVTVTLLSGCSGNTVVGVPVTTNASGNYSFTGLAAGQYRVQMSNLPAGFVFSPQNQGGNDITDSDVNPVNGISDCITLLAGQSDPNWDAGINQPAAPTPTNTPAPPTATPTNTPVINTAQLGNRIWNDANRNGILDTGEVGVPGVRITLLSGCSGSTVLGSRTSDASGYYGFANLAAGQYRIQVSNLPVGYVFSPQNQGANEAADSDVNPTTGISDCITLAAGQADNRWDAGIYLATGPTATPTATPVTPTATPTSTPTGNTAQLGNRVWFDASRNGILDTGETGAQGVTITLLSGCSGSTVLGSRTSDASGYYGFANLAAGQYRIQVSNLPAGYIFTSQNQGANEAADSDVNPATGISDCITLAAGQIDNRWDAGIMPFATKSAIIGDRVWLDANGDGLFNGGESGVPTINVNLLSSCTGSAIVASATTDSSGLYSFANLAAGQYRLQVNLPTGYGFTLQNQGADDAIDSDVNPASSLSDCITLGTNQSDNRWDIGLKLTQGPGTAAVGDRVWEDLNHNGIQDGDEPGLPGAKVGLYRAGALVLAQVADAGGNFLFTNLAPSSYYLCFQQPTTPLFYALTLPLQGGNPALDSDPDPATGCTAAFTLNAGQLDRTRDAGFFDPPADLRQALVAAAVSEPEIDDYLANETVVEVDPDVAPDGGAVVDVEMRHQLYLPMVTQE